MSLTRISIAVFLALSMTFAAMASDLGDPLTKVSEKTKIFDNSQVVISLGDAQDETYIDILPPEVLRIVLSQKYIYNAMNATLVSRGFYSAVLGRGHIKLNPLNKSIL
jgi:hypothetical protein